MLQVRPLTVSLDKLSLNVSSASVYNFKYFLRRDGGSLDFDQRQNLKRVILTGPWSNFHIARFYIYEDAALLTQLCFFSAMQSINE